MIRFNKLIKPIKNGSLERYLNKIGSISICELGWPKADTQSLWTNRPKVWNLEKKAHIR